MNKNTVIFKGVPNGLLIMLDQEISFEQLKTDFEEKIKQNKDFFAGANTSIAFKGRALSEDEELILLKIISKNSGLNISFIHSTDLENNKKTPLFNDKNSLTTYYKGSLRSGQKIDFAGSVVVIGDVNPGAKICAEGNIIVLGKLKGFAHAGCKGADNCFISALYLNPTQLIIKDIITVLPNDLAKNRGAEYAYIKDNQIFIAPLLS